MNDSRQRILERLRANRRPASSAPALYHKPLGWNLEQCIEQFSARMQAVRGEVHRMPSDQWPGWIAREIGARGMQRALVGHGAIAEAFSEAAAQTFDIHRYDRPIEEWKPQLFNEIDFAVTGARAGLAESGSLVLWPSPEEPRLMSLVPELHIAVLEVDRLYENFAQMLASEDWTDGMPTNALLISGPSKTADIEQTLAYGIHGPKQLITLLID